MKWDTWRRWSLLKRSLPRRAVKIWLPWSQSQQLRKQINAVLKHFILSLGKKTRQEKTRNFWSSYRSSPRKIFNLFCWTSFQSSKWWLILGRSRTCECIRSAPIQTNRRYAQLLPFEKVVSSAPWCRTKWKFRNALCKSNHKFCFSLSISNCCGYKTERKPRMCLDCQLMNFRMSADWFLVSNAEEILEVLNERSFSTTLDLFSDYWQVSIAKECRDMANFTCKFVTYRFEVTAFSLLNAPATFQWKMKETRKDLQFCRVNFNDTVVFFKSKNQLFLDVVELYKETGNAGPRTNLKHLSLTNQKFVYLFIY